MSEHQPDIDDRIRALVDNAPPLTPEQASRPRALLRYDTRETDEAGNQYTYPDDDIRP